ncbi:MAG: cation:proton antiporter [Actinomycetota bacterium]|nr:cation:proton antiporter [Actinomycetota bacterium]
MTRDILLTLSILLGGALAARFVASLLRVPEILVLVAFGALLGPSLLDVVDVPFDSVGAQLLFTLGVSLILFYGGLNLSVTVLRQVWVGLGMLVIPGVILTMLVTGAVAHYAFDLSWTAALLMGAVLAPTDPAILIPLFVRSRLRTKVAQTVVAESAFNDPTGAILALTLAGVVIGGGDSIAAPAGDFVLELAISTVIGIVAGVLLAATISSRRAGIWRESSAAAVLTVVTISYFSLDSAGGSGYLGAFLAGLIVGNMQHLGLAMESEHEREMRQFAFNMADLVTLFVFLVLGANIPFAVLGDNLLPALAVIAALLLLARPLTVLVCTLPDRGGSWTWPELAFLCWTRETGVVPAALVGVLAGLGVPNIEMYASVVALAIILTLLLQALPAARLASRLGLLDAQAPARGEMQEPAPEPAA